MEKLHGKADLCLFVADDPPGLWDVGMDVKLGKAFFLGPRHETGKGFVPVPEKSLMWRQGSTIVTFHGLTTNESGGDDESKMELVSAVFSRGR